MARAAEAAEAEARARAEAVIERAFGRVDEDGEMDVRVRRSGEDRPSASAMEEVRETARLR